jgi:signal transduction histidine kinase
MILDIKTLVMVLIVISFISAFALFFFSRILDQVNGLKLAAVGGGFQVLASCFCYFILDTNNLTFAIMLTDVSYYLSFVFYYQAARLLSDLKTAWRFPLGFLMVLLPVTFIFRSHDYIDERIVVTTLGIGILLMMTSYVIFKSKARLPTRIMLAFTFLLSVVACVWTIINVLMVSEQVNVASDFRVLQFAFLWLAGVSFLITLLFIILTLEKLQQQLKVQVSLLQDARDIAHDSLKQQRNFMSMLSHEFKGPIAAIKANADAVILLQKDKAPIVSASLNRMKEVSERLSKLVDHCLSNEWLAHSIEEHNSALEPLSLRDVLQKVSDEYSINVSGIASSAMIKGEPIFLPILFSNLIDNACHYASDIDTVEFELTENTRNYIVYIRDDGPGIAQAQQAHIFERYYQANTENSDSGSGLGLYFVKRITEMHGGTVSVDCQAKTTFTVTLPKQEAVDA